MRLIPQRVEWVQKPPINCLELLESAGRTCYQSSHRVKPGSAKDFVKMILEHKHYSVLRHCVATFRLITDRGVLAELTRHQLSDFNGEDSSWIDPVDGAAYSVESTRYVDYKNRGLEFIVPVWLPKDLAGTYVDTVSGLTLVGEPPRQLEASEVFFINGCVNAAYFYEQLRGCKWSAQYARQMLNMSTKTSIVMTCNMEQWRNVFEQRCTEKAHPQCRELMRDVLFEMFTVLPDLFGDLAEKFLPEVGPKL